MTILFNHIVIPRSGPNLFASLTKGSQPGSAGSYLPSFWAFTNRSPNLLTVQLQLTVLSVGNHVYINSHLRIFIVLQAVNPCDLLLQFYCLHSRKIQFRNP